MLTTLASRYSRQFASAAVRTFASQGEVVLVTGASSGIGYETAVKLGASGYRVIGAARRVEQLGDLVAEIEGAGGTGAACYLDVTDETSYEALFKFAETRFGGVDHVFLNAGAATKLIGPGDMDTDEDTNSYKAGFNVNVIGTVLGMKHGIAALRKRGGGSIITVSSNGGGSARGFCKGDLGDLTFTTPICLASASLDQLVRIASYYQNENIRVYGLKPGIYRSAMIDQWIERFKEQDPYCNEDSIAGFNFFFKGLPGDPAHIANIIETLINNTTKWAPGSNISCDNDATFCSSLSYKIADTDIMFPEIGLDDIRGYDGGEYTPQEERTAAYIENLKAQEARIAAYFASLEAEDAK